MILRILLQNPRSRPAISLLHFFAVGALILLIVLPTWTAQMQSTAGYQDFQFGSSCNSTSSGEKPQSKLWFTDGSWWGMLCNPSSQYHVYRLNLATQTWIDTGVSVLNSASSTKVDVFWDEPTQKLYVASNVFTGGTTGHLGSQPANLYRLTYNASTDSYSVDSGFPVVVARGTMETLVITKDSTGQLWVTFTQDSKVWVNSSQGSDAVWGTPFLLPVSATSIDLSSDDISSILAFQGKVGVMWSNESKDKMYFAIHQDSAADNVWLPEEIVTQGNGIADDHINMHVDSTGRLFIASKTSLTGSNPLVVMLVRQTNGQWSSIPFGLAEPTPQSHTRPVLLLDEAHNLVHMFATSDQSGGAIYYKTSSMNNPSFPPGIGTPVILFPNSLKINNSATTDQNVTSATGMVVIATDQDNDRYFHTYISISSGGNPTSTPTATGSATKTSTPTPTPTNTPTSTQTPIPGPQMTFSATDDAHVKSDSPNSNYGSLDNLRLRGVDAPTYNTYLKFNVSGVTRPVTRATLRLFAYDGSTSGGSVYAVSNNYLGGSVPWLETGLKYSNAPAIGGAPLSTVSTTVANNTWVEYNVTAAVTGNGTYSFGITLPSTNSLFFFSSEAASNQPQLVLDFGTGPTFTSTPISTATRTPTPTNTPTPTKTPGPQTTFAASDDAHVKSDSPNNNYGSVDNLRLRGVNAPIYNSYLKFNVAGLTGTVTRATLRLFAYDGSTSGGSVYAVSNNYLGGSTPWTESGLKYSNAPAIGGSPLSTVSGTVADNTWVEYDVTAAITGNGTFSFAISLPATNSLFFSSSEALSNQPQLVIQTGGGGSALAARNSLASAQTLEQTPESVSSPVLLVGSSQCVNGQLQFMITNPGDGMPEALGYTVLGPNGALEPGNFGPLGTGETASISFADMTSGSYMLFVGLDGLTINADCALPTPTLETTVEVTEVATAVATETLTELPTNTPTETPTEAATETPTELPTALPTDTPAPTSTNVVLATATPTPLPLSLPFFDTFDQGQSQWLSSGGWTAQDAALIGKSGAFWYMNLNDSSVSTLSLLSPLDLRSAQSPQLHFDSLLIASHSLASVEISLDGLTWQPLLAVPSTTDWQTLIVDLSAYQQQVVWLRWTWQSQVPAAEQPPDFWMLDNVSVADAPVNPPTDTPTPTATALLEPTLVPSEVITPVLTLELIPSPESTIAPMETTEASGGISPGVITEEVPATESF